MGGSAVGLGSAVVGAGDAVPVGAWLGACVGAWVGVGLAEVPGREAPVADGLGVGFAATVVLPDAASGRTEPSAAAFASVCCAAGLMDGATVGEAPGTTGSWIGDGSAVSGAGLPSRPLLAWVAADAGGPASIWARSVIMRPAAPSMPATASAPAALPMRNGCRGRQWAPTETP